MANKETIVKSPSGRVKRTRIGVRNVLTVHGKDPDFHYRLVNDVGDRVEVFKGGGYDVVPAKDVRIGDNRVNGTSPEGSIAQASVGGGQKSILMRIPIEFYEEDQLAKREEDESLIATTKSKALDGTYGKLETHRD